MKPPQSEVRKKNPNGRLIAERLIARSPAQLLPVHILHVVMKPTTATDRRTTAITAKNAFVEAIMFTPVKVNAHGIRWSDLWSSISGINPQPPAKKAESPMRDIPPNKFMKLTMASKITRLPTPTVLILLGEYSPLFWT